MNAHQFLKAIGPVHHWYQSDECAPRENTEILQDIVSDLQMDREAALLLHRIVVELRKVDGEEAHRIMPQIWPLLCDALKMMPAPSTPSTMESSE